ncbi:MAG: class I SAM-dependent methyltransferase [Gemmataceae bacterium]
MLASSQSASHPAHHYPMRDWRQIEDPEQILAVEERLARLPRLRVYEHPELYELAYPGFPDDTEFYCRQAATGAVLYLGVGTGRIFAALARVNPGAIGLDSSEAMLRILRERYPDIAREQVRLGSSADIELPADSFDTIIAPFCFLEVMNDRDRERTLVNVARWLKPGGQFVTDTFSTFVIPFRKSGLETIAFSPIAGTDVEIFIRYDHCRQTMREATVLTRNGDSQVTEMDLHYAFPHELSQAFRRAGLEEPGILGGYQGQPFLPSASEIIVYHTRRPRSAVRAS